MRFAEPRLGTGGDTHAHGDNGKERTNERCRFVGCEREETKAMLSKTGVLHIWWSCFGDKNGSRWGGETDRRTQHDTLQRFGTRIRSRTLL